MENRLFKLVDKYLMAFDRFLDWLIRTLVGPKMWRNWFWLFAFFYFSTWVIIGMSVMAMFSRNWSLEIFKWTQFFCLLIVIFALASRLSKKLSFPLIGGLIFFYAVLVVFFSKTNTHLTYIFLSRNIADIGSIREYVVSSLIMVAIISLIGCLIINKLSRHLWHPAAARYTVILIAATVFFLPYNFRNELAVFAQTSYQYSVIVDYYQKFYDSLINDSVSNKTANLAKWQAKADQPLPSYLDNIIFLHLESFNGQLATASITPNFYNFARNNYFFPRFYANNIQTIYGQENILCSMPGSFGEILVESGADKRILCLPEMLAAAGYRTFFTKAGDLSFAHTNDFMKNIGFSETHNEDLMQPNDPKYNMGYREDVYYNRVFDYLNNHPAKKNLIYIAVSGTNHWPFEVPADITPAQKTGLPYQNPKSFEEHLSNNTYLQDSYLNVALKRIDELFPKRNYTLMIFGDHAWPLGRHPKNIFIGADCYEENFSDTLAIKIGDEKEYQNKIAASAYSQMDIVPSLADLFDVDYATSTLKRSFFAPDESAKYSILTIQPVAAQCLNVIRLKDNQKLHYDAYYDKADIVDLNSDPMEESPEPISLDKKSISPKIMEFMDFVAPLVTD